MVDCLCCEEELVYQDYFGNYLGHNQWDVKGDIYKYLNEDCESYIFNYYFYSYRIGTELYKGYPC